MRVVDTVVFADGEGGGNPCPVVLDADVLSSEDMQTAAATFGHETAFVLEPQGHGDVRLRYFVPRHEMEMCVHASVAVAVLLGEPALSLETPLGVRAAFVDEDAAVIEQSPPQFGPVVEDVDSVLAALGASAVSGPVLAVSTARAKLMIPLVDESALDALRPDPDLIAALCDALDVTGLYPYVVGARGADVAARQFPRSAGYVEDPATGVAACALGALLAARAGKSISLTIAQGRAMGRPSLITTHAEHDGSAVVATRVGGRAKITGDRL